MVKLKNKRTPALNERFFLESVTHPTKVSRHRETPTRAPKIQISFMFAASPAGPRWQRGIYTELYFSHQTHPIDPIAPCDPLLTVIRALKVTSRQEADFTSKKINIFSTDTSKTGRGGVGSQSSDHKNVSVLSDVFQGRGKQGQAELIPNNHWGAGALPAHSCSWGF